MLVAIWFDDRLDVIDVEAPGVIGKIATGKSPRALFHAALIAHLVDGGERAQLAYREIASKMACHADLYKLNFGQAQDIEILLISQSGRS